MSSEPAPPAGPGVPVPEPPLAAVASTAVPAAPPPPPPPAPPAFDASAQARALFSRLDPTGLRPTAAVAGIILAMFLGAQLVNALIPQSAVGPGQPRPGAPAPVQPGPVQPGPAQPGPGNPGPLPPASTLTIGPLRLPLEAGWTPQEVPNSNIIVRLVKGSVAMDVLSATIQGQADAASVHRFYISQMQSTSSGFQAAQPNLVQVGNGIPAARGNYTGLFGENQIEGQVTTMVVAGTGFIFDVWAPAGTLGSLQAETQRMIDNLQAQ